MHIKEAEPTFLVPQEFGARLQPPLSAAQIRGLCDRGEIKAHRTPGGYRVIPIAELARFEADRAKRR